MVWDGLGMVWDGSKGSKGSKGRKGSKGSKGRKGSMARAILKRGSLWSLLLTG